MSLAAPPTPRRADGSRVIASPAARRVAAERGVDLAELPGTGPGGRIVAADVTGARPPAAPGPRRMPASAPGEAPGVAGGCVMHRRIAAGPALHAVDRLNAEPGRGVSLADLVTRALGLALRDVIADACTVEGIADPAALTVTDIAAARDAPAAGPEGLSVALADYGALGVDAAEIPVPEGAALLLTIGRIAADPDALAMTLVLKAAPDIAPEDAARILARLADRMEDPVTLLT